MADPWEEDWSAPGEKPWERDWSAPVANASQQATAEAEAGGEPSTMDLVRHVAGGIPQAGFDILDLPTNVARGYTQAIDYLFGENGAFPNADRFVYSIPQLRAIKGIADMPAPTETSVGVPIKEFLAKETVTREQAPAADAMRTALEWGSGGLVSGARRLAGKGVSMLPDLIMGGAAGLGQYAGGDTGELVGGLVGLAAAMRTGDFSKLSKAEQNALDLIRRNADNPELAMKNLQQAVESGEIGSLADLTDDAVLFDIEAALRAIDPSFGRRLDDLLARRESQAINTAGRTLSSADAGPAQELARQATTGRQQRITDAVDSRRAADAGQTDDILRQSEDVQEGAARTAEEAQQAVTEAAGRLNSNNRASDLSRRVSERLDDVEAGIRGELETPAWNAFREGPKVKTQRVKEYVESYLNKLVPEERQFLMEKYGGLLRMVDNWDSAVPPQSMQSVLSEMKKRITNAGNTGNYGSAEKFLNDIAAGVDETLEASNDLYAAAKQATRDRVAATGGDAVNKARRTAEPEKLIRTLGLTDENGAVLLRNMESMDDPMVKALVSERLRRAATMEGVDQAFIDKYDDILEAFPGMRAQLQDVVQKNAQAVEMAGVSGKVAKEQEAFRKQTVRQYEARQKALDAKAKKLGQQTEKSLLGQFGNYPDTTVDKLVFGKDTAPALRRLYTALRRRGGGDGFKASVRNRLMDRYTRVTDDGTRAIKPNAYDDFAKRRQTLVDADLLTPQEADTMAIMLARKAGSAARKRAIAEGIQNPMSELNRLAASGVAASVMSVAPGGQSLILAGAVRRAAMAMLRRKISDKELRGLEEFVLNPQKFLQAAKGADSEAAAVDRIMRDIIAAGQVFDTEAPQETEQ